MSENSEAELSIEDFYRYFAKWEDGYPAGVPLAVIDRVDEDEAQESQKSQQSQKSPGQGFFDPQFSLAPSDAVFVAFNAEGRLNLIDAEHDLLQKAVQKGLGWDPTEAVALLLLADKGDGHELEKLDGDLDGLSEHWWVILGEVPAALFDKLPKEKVIQTVSLTEVLESAPKKKQFWNDIKRLVEPVPQVESVL